jgi:iron complex transport system substrate-binding protein
MLFDTMAWVLTMGTTKARTLAQVLGLFLVCACAISCRPATTRDRPDAQSPTDPKPQLRVVCLTPSSTEMVAALGALDWIVGVDEFSKVPPEVVSLPKVGDFLHPNLEATLALHPDIVVADQVQTKAIESLNAAGVTVLSLPMQNLSDIRAAYTALGRALGREAVAVQAIADLDAALEAGAARGREGKAKTGKAPRVLFVVDRRPGTLAGMVAAGPGSYLDDLLLRAGAENVLASARFRYVNITMEEVLALRPDVILDAAHVDDVVKATADWRPLASGVPAVRDARVHVLGDPVYVTPGPRLAAIFPRLVALLWP